MREEEKIMLSEQIKLVRFKRKKTQEDCAKALNISIPTYKNIWFTAETFINVKAIIKAEYTCRLGKD